MQFSELGLNLYRKTVKRFPPAHRATHWLMTHGAIPLLEKWTGFRTMPDDPFWFRLELLTQRHEPETTLQLDNLVQPGMVMLDIGAHVGYYSCRYATQIGADGRLFAFEPHPRTYATLQHNTQRHPNVTAVQVALAAQAGTAQLHDYLMMSASGSLHYDETMATLQQAQLKADDIAPRIGHQFQAQTFTVDTIPVDDFLAARGIHRVDLVKMDIEGAELDALRGMQKTIAHSPGLVLIMEYNPHALHAFGHDPAAVLAEVVDMGFTQMGQIQSDGQTVNLLGEEERISALTAGLLPNMEVVNLLLSKERN